MKVQNRKSWVRVQMVAIAVVALAAWLVLAARLAPAWENIAFGIFGVAAILALLVRCEACGAKGYRRTKQKMEAPGPFFFFPPNNCPDCDIERYWPERWRFSFLWLDEVRRRFEGKSWAGLKIKVLAVFAFASFASVYFATEISIKNGFLNFGLFLVLLMHFVRCESCEIRGIKKTDRKFEFLRPLFFLPPSVCPKCGIERLKLKEIFTGKSQLPSA